MLRKNGSLWSALGYILNHCFIKKVLAEILLIDITRGEGQEYVTTMVFKYLPHQKQERKYGSFNKNRS